MAKKKTVPDYLKGKMPNAHLFIGNQYMCTVERLAKNQFKILTVKEIKPLKVATESDENAGHIKYYVANQRLGIYTCIGADNLHHASNKATKLFGPDGWSFLRNEYQTMPSLNNFEAKPYKEFKALIKTLPN